MSLSLSAVQVRVSKAAPWQFLLHLEEIALKTGACWLYREQSLINKQVIWLFVKML